MNNTKIKIKCVGGGESSLFAPPATDHLLQPSPATTISYYNYLLQPSPTTAISCNHPLLQPSPTTTISYSYASSPEKKKTSSNRLGPSLSRGLRSQKGPRPFNPLRNSLICTRYMDRLHYF